MFCIFREKTNIIIIILFSIFLIFFYTPSFITSPTTSHPNKPNSPFHHRTQLREDRRASDPTPTTSTTPPSHSRAWWRRSLRASDPTFSHSLYPSHPKKKQKKNTQSSVEEKIIERAMRKLYLDAVVIKQQGIQEKVCLRRF